MKIDYKVIGSRVKRQRMEKGMTQQELAERLDVSNAYLSRIERGSAKASLEMIFKISSTLEIPVCLILSGVDVQASDYLSNEIYELILGCTPSEKRLIYDLIKAVRNQQSKASET